MAEKKQAIFTIGAEVGDTSGIDNLQNKLNNVNKTNLSKPFTSYKSAIKDAISDAARLEQQFGKNSAEFKNAAVKVAELKDQFQAFNTTIGTFNPDAKFQLLNNTAKASIGIFQGYSGALAAIGADGEDSAKTLAKLQGLMAFSDAFNSIGDIKDAFSDFSNQVGLTTVLQKANAAATTVTSVAMKALGISTSSTSTGFKVLKGAFMGLGIGLLVAGITLLVENFGAIKKAVLNLIPGLADVGAFFGGLIDKITDFVGVTSEAERATKKLIESSESQIKATDEFLDANGYKYDEYTKRKIEANNNYLKKVVEVSKDETKTEAQKQALLKQYRDKADFEIDKASKDRNKKIADDVEKANEKIKKKNEEAASKAKQVNDKKLADLKQYNQEVDKENADARKTIGEKGLSDRQKELFDLSLTHQKQLELFKKKGRDTQFIEQANAIKVKAINDKYNKEINEGISQYLGVGADEFETNEKKISETFDKLIANADDGQKKFLKNVKAFALAKNETNKQLSSNSIVSQTEVLKTERTNVVLKTDTPDEAKAKIDNVLQSKLKAEDDAFKLELEQKQLNDEQKELAEEGHLKRINDLKKVATDESLAIDEAAAQRKKDIDKAVQEHKQSMADMELGIAEKGVGLLSSLAGKNKALQKAAIIADNAIGIAKIVTSTKAANAAVTAKYAPIPGGVALAAPEIALNTVSAGLGIAASVVATTKALAALKAGGSAAGTPTLADTAGNAPVINAQAATAQQIQDVRVTNNGQLVKAVISDSELQSQEQKRRFLSNLSEF